MENKSNQYEVKVNNFVFSFSQNEVMLADIVEQSSGNFHILQNSRAAQVQIIEADLQQRAFKAVVGGEIFFAEIKNELDLVIDSMGYTDAANTKLTSIKAPMPGLVLQISVAAGQQVSAGDTLLILEAMKMENSILVQDDAVIKHVAVKPGQAVEKGQLLVELE